MRTATLTHAAWTQATTASTPAVFRFALLALVLLSPLVLARPLSGQGWIEPPPDMRVPFGVERLRTHVQIRVVDRIAHVEVEEWFRNNGGGLAEGTYLYPLSGEAVFQSYSLFQGDEELTGETMDAEQARAIYQEIVRSRKDPALIELVGHGLLRARVFPINPGETRRIVLRYTQLLEGSSDALELRYTAGMPGGARHPRPIIRPLEGERPPREHAHTTRHDGAPLTFTVTVEDGDAFLDPFSPTHPLRVTREDGRIVVRPDDELSGRFVLFLPPTGEPVRVGLATYRPSSEDGYFMLSLSPEQVAASAMPRDLTVVVDVSGSMSGEKIEQTRRAVSQLLATLGPDDRFRLIRFSSEVETYRSGWTPAGPDELRDARRWAEGLRADGGTNIAGALNEAFRDESPAGRLPFVVFLTDGLPTVGEADPERIADQADRRRGGARVFAFGVGYDVNTYLLDRLTVAGRGSIQYVEPGEDVERALSVLAERIQHPVLADLELEELPVRVREVFPRDIPDLFAGQELTLFGRYTEPGKGAIAVRGQREGQVSRFSADGDFPAHAVDNDFIPRLWAARKIGELTREVRLRGQDPELIEEIRETALRYGILTEYTSHLVLEPGVLAGGPGGAPPPVMIPAARDMTGQGEVLRSEAARRSREARTAADVVAFEQLAIELAAPPRTEAGDGRGNPRIVAGRAFAYLDGVWIDRLHADDARIIDIEAFGPAYFDLLAALPELRAWWSQLSPVIVAGRELSLRIAEVGATRLSAYEIRRIVREFRGS